MPKNKEGKHFCKMCGRDMKLYVFHKYDNDEYIANIINCRDEGYIDEKYEAYPQMHNYNLKYCRKCYLKIQHEKNKGKWDEE